MLFLLARVVLRSLSCFVINMDRPPAKTLVNRSCKDSMGCGENPLTKKPAGIAQAVWDELTFFY